MGRGEGKWHGMGDDGKGGGAGRRRMEGRMRGGMASIEMDREEDGTIYSIGEGRQTCGGTEGGRKREG
jgi:hypothetical protein